MAKAAAKKQPGDLNRIMARCRWHKPMNLGYIGWDHWAAAKVKKGHVQKKCPDCRRVYFKEEWGTPPRGRAWSSVAGGKKMAPPAAPVNKGVCRCGHSLAKHSLNTGPKNAANLDHCMGTAHNGCGCVRYSPRVR